MAWVKIPKEHHDLVRAALPRDPRISTINMFGGLVAMVKGHMFGGTFGRSAIARLAADDLAEAMQLDGTELFDPMGRGVVMRDVVLLSASVMEEPDELQLWMRRAFDYSVTLPVKKKKAMKKTHDT